MPQKRRNGLSFVECVWQPVPNSGHDIAERPVAPYTSACCLCSHRTQRCFVCTEERRERSEWYPWRTGLYPWGTERVCVDIVSVGNGFLLILYLWGTDFFRYCVQWFVVRLCRVFLSYGTWQG